jgi:hypothetical protein
VRHVRSTRRKSNASVRVARSSPALLDHLVGAGEERRRYVEAEHSRISREREPCPHPTTCSSAPKICSSLPWREKGPSRLTGRGKLSRAELSGLFGPIRSALTGWAERFLVTLPTSKDLFTRAKDLFVEAMAPRPRH